MKHEELYLKLRRTKPHFQTKALKAVMELHKPQDSTIPQDPKCDACSGLDWEDYPCPTIQAIEKELA